MDDTTPGGGGPSPGGPAGVPGMAPSSGGPVAERMQALLSRAVEEQVSEQRATSSMLSDLRLQLASLADSVRGLATGDRVEQLASDLGSLTNELRRSTGGLGERVDAVARTLDQQVTSTSEQAAAGSAGTEAVAVRLGALGADVAAQSAGLHRVGAALGALATFPDALAALQGEIAGLHDRLVVLSDLRNGLADLTSRTGALEQLRPDLAAVVARVQDLATASDVSSSRDSLVVALGDRLQRLETAASRPVVGPDELDTALDAALADVRERVAEAAAGGPALARLDGVDTRVEALERRLEELGSRLSDLSASTAALPAVADGVSAVSGRLDALDPLRDDVAALGTAIASMREQDAAPALVRGVEDLRGDVEDLGGRVDALTVPSADAVALAVSGQVGDRIVDALAPRVADVVLTRVAAVLVDQVASTVTASVQNGLTDKVRAATAESERRMSAHVDEAILALAEALLRRRRPGRTVPAVASPAPAAPAPEPGAAGREPAAADLTTAVALPGLAADEPAADAPAPDEAAPNEAAVDEPAVDEPARQEAAVGPQAADDDGPAHHGEQPEAPLDPAEEQAEAELEGRAALADAVVAGNDAPDTADAETDGADTADAETDGAETDRAEEMAFTEPEPEPEPEPEVIEADADDVPGTGDGPASAVEEPVVPGTAASQLQPEVALDPTEQQAEAELEGRAGPAREQADPPAADPPAADPPAAEQAGGAGGDAESPSERTGAFALRSGLRGLGLHVDDPDLSASPARPRTAPPARPRLLDPTPDLDDDDREPVRAAAPVRPRRELQQRFASVSNAFGAREDDEDDEDEESGMRRRPWWRPGG